MNEVLIEALTRIARFKRGGLVVFGEHSGDRDTMIGIARVTLDQYKIPWRRDPES